MPNPNTPAATPSITIRKDADGIVWLNFVAPDGNQAMLNLNNVISERPDTFTTRAMADAVNAYPADPPTGDSTDYHGSGLPL